MGKRSIVILSTLGVFLLIVASILLYRSSIRVVNKPENTAAISTTENSKQGSDGKSGLNSDGTSEEVAVKVIKSEEVKVLNNSPEYDFKASIYENSLNETYLKFEYYSEGTGIVKEFGYDKIPELKDMFINSISFNPKKSKAYFIIEGKNQAGDTGIALYCFSLKDSNVKKIFEGVGKSSELKFSNSSNYLAFNFMPGVAVKGSEPENNYFQVVNCDTDELIIKNSSANKGNLIGGEKDKNLRYEYSFISWNNNTSAKVKEIKYLMDKNGNVTGIKGQSELVYDIEKNVLLNADGSIVNDTKASSISTGGAAQIKTESDCIKILRNYYLLMSSEQYGKANELLDNKFTLKLKMFKQFGIDELTKSDMDVNNMALYGSLFKTAKIESIVSEKAARSNSTIYFYLTYSMGESDQIKQPLIANLVKSDKGWKILSVSDGNENESPFKK